MLCIVTSCQSKIDDGGPTATKTTNANKSNSAQNNGDLGNSDDAGADGTLSQNPATPSTAPDQQTTNDYPLLSYKGSGQTSYRGEMHPVTNTFQSQASPTDLVTNMLAASAISKCHTIFNIGCPSQNEINQKVNAGALGNTRFIRANSDNFAKLIKEQGFKDANYLMFMDGIVNNKGVTFNFSKPLPIFPWPGKADIYAPLDQGPQVWEAMVTGGGASFNARLTATKIAAATGSFTMKITLDIPQDTNGAIYELFAVVAREATYNINLADRVYERVQSTYFFANDKNERETLVMTYGLCTATKNGNTKNYPCP